MLLPTDVVDHILSFLQSDITTLETCSRSHPTLSKLSERYIYAKVTLHNDKWIVIPDGLTEKISKFAKIIAKNPNIAKHVRNLKVYVDDNVNSNKMTATYLNNVASMLPTFSRLKKITLSGFGRGSCMSWHTLPVTFCQAFQHLLRVQCIEDVSILYAHFLPLSLLNDCKTLRLTLHFCLDIQYDKGSIEDQPYQPLEHLYIQYCYEEMEKIASWVQLRSLRSLRVTLDEQSEFKDFLPQLLAACSSTLIRLDLDIAHLFHTFYKISPESGVECQDGICPFPFTLAGLLYIEQLTIRMTCVVPQNGKMHGWGPTPAIMDLISTASPNLKQIFLDFTLSFRIRVFPDPDIIWAPFIPLAEKCSSLSITISVCANFKFMIRGGGDKYLLPPSEIFSSLSGCGGLKPYVEKGVFILISAIE